MSNQRFPFDMNYDDTCRHGGFVHIALPVQNVRDHVSKKFGIEISDSKKASNGGGR